MSATTKPVLLLQGSSKFGGSKQSLLTIVRVLKESGYEPVIACSQRGWLTEQLDRTSTKYALLPFFAWRKWLERFRVRPSIRQRWLPALREWKFQLVHSNEFWWAPQAVILAKELKIPALVHLRDGHHTLKKARQYRLKEADAVIAVSSELREQFAEDAALHARTRVLFNGHDEEAVRFAGAQREARAILGLDPRLFVIGNAGTVCERKNQRMLVRTVGELKRSGRLAEFKLIFAGEIDPAYWPSVQQEIDRWDLRNETLTLGNVSNMAAFYAAADLIVHCARREGLPRIIPEAMLAERPVIATLAEGVRDAIPDDRYGVVTPAEDVAALQKEIEALATDGERRSRIARSAYERARSCFSLSAHRVSLTRLYEEISRPQIMA